MSILQRILVVCNLQEGQTIDSYGNVQDVGSWSTTISRYSYGESHVTTCNYLHDLTEELISSVNANMYADSLQCMIPDFIKGLKTYVQTTSTKPYASYVANRMCITIGKLSSLQKRETPKEIPSLEHTILKSLSTNISLEQKDEQKEDEQEEDEQEEEEKKTPFTEEELRMMNINILRQEISDLQREKEYVLREKNRLQTIIRKRIRSNLKKACLWPS